MAITVKYDKPTNSSLAVDTSIPGDSRNMARDNHLMGTVTGQITLDSSYPTGGYAAPDARFGMSSLGGVFFENASGYALVYNRSTNKIQVYVSGGTEVTNATDLSALQAVYFRAEGLI